MKTVNVFSSKGRFQVTLFAHHDGDEKSFKHDWNNAVECQALKEKFTIEDVLTEMKRYGWQILVPPVEKVLL